MDIEDLISKARSGDVESYGPVVKETQARLRAFIAAYCPHADRIDEVAQRAYVWAYEHLDRYEPGTRFYAWLKTIARNLLLAELEAQRREAHNRRRYLDHLQASVCRDELSGHQDGPDTDLAAALKSCLDALPSESRNLIARRYERSEPVVAIARDLARSEAGLKVTLFRIRQALRKCVEVRLAAGQV